jgi:hypothetical protein
MNVDISMCGKLQATSRQNASGWAKISGYKIEIAYWHALEANGLGAETSADIMVKWKRTARSFVFIHTVRLKYTLARHAGYPSEKVQSKRGYQ